MIKKKIFLIIVLLNGVLHTWAQDVHFSQFFASPLTLNPAQTGWFDGYIRFNGNFKSQWTNGFAGFKTYTASVDGNIPSGAEAGFNSFGVGLVGIMDNAGSSNFTSKFLGLSLAYHKALDEDGNTMLSAGIQLGKMNKSVDLNKLIFESQLTNTGFDPQLSNQEPGLLASASYWDINAGVMARIPVGESNSAYFGTSVYHINSAVENFAGSSSKIPRRFTLQAGGVFGIGYRANVHVSNIYMMQSKASELVTGAALEYRLNEDENNPTVVYAGGWYRLGDAIIPYFGLEFKKILIGASYDVATNGLNPIINKRGGTELSVRMNLSPDSENEGRIPCPKF